MDKDSARKQKLEEMKSHKNIGMKSSIITEKLMMLEDFHKANDTFIYVSDSFEVNTANIIQEAKRLGKDVYCPVIRSNEIKPGVFESGLKPGMFGILEPKDVSNKHEFDLIIVPGLAFDKNGTRVGRGGGHFDRFLAKTAGKKIGLAFDFQILDKIDSEKHDIPMDMVLTEKRTIRIKKDNL